MKKYRLNTDQFKGFEYGEILYPHNDGEQYGKKDAKLGDRCLSKNWIEKMPELFEEVKEKDYEILEIAYESGVICEYKGHVASFHENKDEFIKYFLASPAGYKIHSVKRISDGEVFSIGNINDFGIIEKFEVINGAMNVFFKNKEDYNVCIGGLKPIKKPIFKTEDGGEYFETHKPIILYGVWITESDSISYEKFDKIKHEHFLRNSYPINTSDWLWFSTDEKAQEYIDLNKPKYSLQDIINAYESPKPSFLFDSLMDNLQKLNR